MEKCSGPYASFERCPASKLLENSEGILNWPRESEDIKLRNARDFIANSLIAHIYKLGRFTSYSGNVKLLNLISCLGCLVRMFFLQVLYCTKKTVNALSSIRVL